MRESNPGLLRRRTLLPFRALDHTPVALTIYLPKHLCT